MHQPFVGSASRLEEDTLADSTYELINTDGETESQDGRATESVASSLDLLARPDDVDSLVGMENTQAGDDGQVEDEDYEDDERHERGHGQFELLKQLEHLRCHEDAEHSEENEVQRGCSRSSSVGATAEGLGTPSSSAQQLRPAADSKHATPQCLFGDLPCGRSPSIERAVSTSEQAHKSSYRTPGPDEGRDIPHGRVFSAPSVSGFFKDFDFRPWVRPASVTAATIIMAIIVPMLLPALGSRSSLSSIASVPPSHTPRVQTASTTTVSVPTTVTVTITSTKTVPPYVLHDFAKMIADTADGAARAVEDTCLPVLFSVASKIREDTKLASDSIKGAGKAAQGYSGVKLDHLRDSLERTFAKFRREAQEKMAPHLRAAENLGEDIDFTILKAQISSRLIWLKLRGNVTEYQRYRDRAVDFMRTKRRLLTDKRARRDADGIITKHSWGHRLRWRLGG